MRFCFCFFNFFCNEGNMFDIKTTVAVVLNELLYFCHHDNNYRRVLIFRVFGYHASHLFLFLFLMVSPYNRLFFDPGGISSLMHTRYLFLDNVILRMSLFSILSRLYNYLEPSWEIFCFKSSSTFSLCSSS